MHVPQFLDPRTGLAVLEGLIHAFLGLLFFTVIMSSFYMEFQIVTDSSFVLEFLHPVILNAPVQVYIHFRLIIQEENSKLE